MRGTYTIILRLTDHTLLVINKKQFELKSGIYIYVGSALGPGGIVARLNRHLKIFASSTLKKHWHIDSLLPFSTIFASVYAFSTERLECRLVHSLKRIGFQVVEGFGNTDCTSWCGGHLVYVGDLDLEDVTQKVIAAFEALGLKATIGLRSVRDRSNFGNENATYHH